MERILRSAVALAVAAVVAVAVCPAVAAGAGGPDAAGTEFVLAVPPAEGAATATLWALPAGEGEAEVHVRIEAGDEQVYDETRTSPDGTPVRFDLPDWARVESGDQPLAVSVTASAPVIVELAEPAAPAVSGDALLAWPGDALGTSYLVAARDGAGGHGFVTIVATADGTEVTVVPSVALAEGPAGEPFTLTLDRGHVYTLVTDGEHPGDLTGTTVSATAPVAVIAGHTCATVPAGAGACDLLAEELTPEQTLGLVAVVAPQEGMAEAELRVVATTDGTEVSANGEPVASLDRGGFIDLPVDAAMSVEADHGILAVLYGTAAGDGARTLGGPFMVQVPTVEQGTTPVRYLPHPAAGEARTVVFLRERDGASLLRNGNPVDTTGFAATGGYLVGTLVETGDDPVTLSADGPLGGYTWGLAGEAGWGLPLPVLARDAATVNHPPVADAGDDQRVECEGDGMATVTLDGTGSHDPDGADDIVLYRWSEGETVLGEGETLEADLDLGAHEITLLVRDAAGEEDTDTVEVTVVDTTPPEGGITFPEAGACFGPDELPVTVTDDFHDTCQDEVERAWTPVDPAAPAPGQYVTHGDWLVTLTATDPAGNSASDRVGFTIDTAPPTVSLLHGPGEQWAFPVTVPFTELFTATDEDGASGDVVHELVEADGCVLYDGNEYGDGDGLLSDEQVTLDTAALCRAAELCHRETWDYPVVTVHAWDCGGNEGTARVQVPVSFTLVPGICPPPGNGGDQGASGGSSGAGDQQQGSQLTRRERKRLEKQRKKAEKRARKLRKKLERQLRRAQKKAEKARRKAEKQRRKAERKARKRQKKHHH